MGGRRREHPCRAARANGHRSKSATARRSPRPVTSPPTRESPRSPTAPAAPSVASTRPIRQPRTRTRPVPLGVRRDARLGQPALLRQSALRGQEPQRCPHLLGRRRCDALYVMLETKVSYRQPSTDAAALNLLPFEAVGKMIVVEHPTSEPDRRTAPHLQDVLVELERREPIFHRPELGTTREDFERSTAPDFWETGASRRRYSRESSGPPSNNGNSPPSSTPTKATRGRPVTSNYVRSLRTPICSPTRCNNAIG